jgi:importin subunit beta-1
VKQQIKAGLLSTLGSAGAEVRHTAALVLAKAAAIEIPRSTWPDLIPNLLSNANSPQAPAGLKHATLEALGYVCEELGAFEEDYIDQEQVNSMLTAVVAGMRPEETDMELRMAATTALNNALEFARSNFSNDQERNYLMQMVCHGTQASDARVRRGAWECLVRIAEFYYSKLPAYMSDIFALSQQAVRSDEEEVALQALELWSTIAEEEYNRDIESDATSSTADSDTADTINHNFVRAALPQLVPLLLEQLTKQEEGADSDDGAWNPSLAAGTALSLAANVVGDPIVELVMPFVQENIQKEDWRAREAATFAFGSILQGPSVESLGTLARAGLGFLLSALKDQNPQVRNTTAWTLGRIFNCVADEELNPPLLDGNSLAPVIGVLLEAIRDEAHIAEKVCYALSQLASVYRDAPPPSPLSPFFESIVGALLETASRHTDAGGDAVRLQMQAFEAVNEVVRASSLEAAELVARLLPVGVGKLMEATAHPPGVPEVAESQAEIQGLLCGVLQVAMQKLSGGSDEIRGLAAQQADYIMQALLRVLTWRAGSVHEEALLAVGALTYVTERDFAKYLEAYIPVLELALQNYQEKETCQFAVSNVGDVCRAVHEQIFPYCDRLMTLLLQILQNNEVHRDIKPQILNAFGDIAMAVGDRFENYLSHVVQVLQSAAGLCIDQAAAAVRDGDEDSFDYVNALRSGILEAWAGMFNGLSKQKVDHYLRAYAPSLIEFIEAISADQSNQDKAVWRSAAALLGDVASSLSGVSTLFQQKPFVKPFLQHCAQNESLRETAQWALYMVVAAEKAGPNAAPIGLQTEA